MGASKSLVATCVSVKTPKSILALLQKKRSRFASWQDSGLLNNRWTKIRMPCHKGVQLKYQRPDTQACPCAASAPRVH
jgi:hypothetical protein